MGCGLSGKSALHGVCITRRLSGSLLKVSCGLDETWVWTALSTCKPVLSSGSSLPWQACSPATESPDWPPQGEWREERSQLFSWGHLPSHRERNIKRSSPENLSQNPFTPFLLHTCHFFLCLPTGLSWMLSLTVFSWGRLDSCKDCSLISLV